jgi:hypothetical protein
MQTTNPAPGLASYIFGAAIAAFALNYCAQSAATAFSASDRIDVPSEPARPMNIVDRSHKGDRLPGGQQTYSKAASGSVAIGDMDLLPATVPHNNNPPRAPSLLPELPDGCESAFSALSAAELKVLAARCFT